MKDELPLMEAIRANAELVATVARRELDVEIDFSEASVRWLDGFVQRQYESGDPANVEGLVSTLGSFLGECIVRTHGGEWVSDDQGVGVAFDERNRAFPFAKIEKHLRNGREDSVLSFFTIIPILFRRPTRVAGE